VKWFPLAALCSVPLVLFALLTFVIPERLFFLFLPRDFFLLLLVRVEQQNAVAQPEDGFCSICTAIVGFVESYVEQNATIAQIQARLDAACALTGPYASECKALVDQYLPQIIAWIEKNETPADICTQLGVCNDKIVKAPEDGFCSICEAIVGFVESYVEQNATIAQIQARLDAACALTGPYASECKALVDQYLPQIIAWIEKNETPADICTQLGVCNTGKQIAAVVPAVTSGGLGCTICKTIVGYIEIYIQQNATEVFSSQTPSLC
jgi:saposin